MGWTNNQPDIITLPVGATGGARIVIDGTRDVILIYNAAGNLFGSMAAAAGSDGLGNNYPAGIHVGVAGSAGVTLNTGADNLTGLEFFTGIVANILNDAKIQLNFLGSGAAEQSFLTIGSAEDATQLDSIFDNFWASSADGTGNAHMATTYAAADGSFQTYAQVGLAGWSGIGSVIAVHPGTGTARNNYAVAETWQTPVLGSGWADGTTAGGDQGFRYRKLPDGDTQLLGTIHSTSATPATTITALASGYFNATTGDRNDFVVAQVAGGVLATNLLRVGTTGNMALFTSVAASSTDVFINGRIRVT